MTRTRLARRKAFSCLQRYEAKAWSEENKASVLGASFTPNGHGHNYELEAYLEGPVDPVTGMVMNLIEIDQILNEVTGPLEGKQLNSEVAEFKNQTPTTEALAAYLYERLETKFSNHAVKLARLRLFDHEDLWVDIWS